MSVMNSRSIPKRTSAAVVFTALLALACAWAFAAPRQAHADELQAASLTVQAAESNTTMYYAQELESGKGVIGTFESEDDSNTNLHEYWYKFKTSNRWSVYSVKVESIDGRYVRCIPYTEGGDKDSDAWKMGWNSENSTTGTLTRYNKDPKKNHWYHFRIDQDYSWGASLYYNNRALRGDRFKITVTEHPVIKAVTGVKSAKTTKSAITLKWNKQDNATKYQVKWKKKKGGSWKTRTVTANKLKFTKLKKGTKYQFKVRAYCENGYDLANDEETNWTAWTSVKTVRTRK